MLTRPQKPDFEARKRVALLIETSNRHGRELVEGITRYGREDRNWHFQLFELARGGEPPDWLAEWDGHGIIARVESFRTARLLEKTRLPIVNLSAARLIATAPLVETDDKAIAKLAYTHFKEIGLNHFAFFGDDRFAWSSSRSAFFRLAVERDGCGWSEFKVGTDRAPSVERQDIAAWLRSLPKPIGILASYDVRARELIDVCLEDGLRVPDDVAVIGIDDEHLHCSISYPSLTSIVLNSERMGYVAADVLARLMRSEEVPQTQILVEPIRLVRRESTDVRTTSDPLVAKAVTFIHANASRHIAVKDVVDYVGTSRRVLETRFQKNLRRTPHNEILNVKVRRVQEMLKASDLPLYRIAEEIGFSHAEYLSVMFKRHTGEWPSVFRERHRMPTKAFHDNKNSGE